MKSKLLFGALLGSIALASCTADEDFSTQATQESPIKFSVSLETADGVEPLTKALLTDRFKLNFENDDLMSLFHGATLNTGATADAKATITGYQNAIYAGTANDGSAFTFTTKSMVQEGKAIMVYPADTTFANNNTNAPRVTIAQEQDENTAKLMPYMSEVLDIKAYNPGSVANTAGYGKYYPIVLKPIGSVLSLQIDAQNVDDINDLGVAELKVTKAGLETNNNVFTTDLYVKATDAAIGYTGSNRLISALWSSVSDVDLNATHVNAVNLLTTKNVSNDKAIFTLLPTSTTDATGAAVTVQTNYGKVVLNSTTERVWKKKTTEQTVKEGLEDVLKNLWVAPKKASTNFGTEKTGGLCERTIVADMADLDMDGLHITDQNHLMDALKVYDAIANNATVTFYLDGDDNGEFVMEAEATKVYEARVASSTNNITFTRSTDSDTKCTAVKFVSTTETEVPSALIFGNSTNVKFEGAWKYSKTNSYRRVTIIEFTKDATVAMSGNVNAGNASTKIVNNGIVNINGVATLRRDLTNNGTINIPVGVEFLVNNAKLNNEEDGKIYNSGSMGVQNQTSGYINNYGYIEQMNADAYTYVTTNATAGANFATRKSANNKIGTIKLFGTGNINTVVSGNMGFVKVVTTATTVGNNQVGTYANYVEINGDCERLSANLGDNIKYVEVKSSRRVIWETINTSLTGLIVDKSYSLNIPRGSSLTATTTYLKGRIYNAGTFTCNDYDGYWGGTNSDSNNVIASN